MPNDPRSGVATAAPGELLGPVTTDGLWHGREDPAGWPLAGTRGQALLAEVGRRLFGSLHIHHCVHTVAEIAVRHLADAVVVVGPPPLRPDGPRVRLAAGGGIEEEWAGDHQITQVPGMVAALSHYPPAPSRWLDPATMPPWVLPTGLGAAGDVLLVPLPGYAGPGGALLLIRRADTRGFDAEDEALARVFAARAGAALSVAALYRAQTEALVVLQAELVPPKLPHIDGVELVGSHQPSEHTLLTGGDFYDAFPPTRRHAEAVVVLGDVCGKGAAAAALTGRVRHTLQALHQVESRPAVLLRVLNEVLLRPDADRPFVTLVVGSLAVADRRVTLTFATGGHPVPLVLRRDGSVQEVDTSGTLIGVVPDVRIGTATVTLWPGDLCLLYSDGVTEARGGREHEQYGEQRLRDALASAHGMPTGALLEQLRQGVCDWVHGGTHDDIALLAIRARHDL